MTDGTASNKSAFAGANPMKAETRQEEDTKLPHHKVPSVYSRCCIISVTLAILTIVGAAIGLAVAINDDGDDSSAGVAGTASLQMQDIADSACQGPGVDAAQSGGFTHYV